MPISYDYEVESGILRCRVGEELVISEIVEYLRTVYRDKRIREGTIEIVHLDQVADFAVRAPDVRDAEPQLHDHVASGKLMATIFVGSKPLQIGIANMLSGLLTTMFPDYSAPVVLGHDEALEEIASIRSGTASRPEREEEI